MTRSIPPCPSTCAGSPDLARDDLEGGSRARAPLPGARVDSAGVKGWRRSIVAGVAIALAGLLAAPPASAQDAPDQDQDEEEEAAPPAPPPKPAKRKPAQAPEAAPAADGADRGDRADKAEKKAGKAGDRDDKQPTPPTPEERALRGVVVVERGGQTLGLGVVLAGDGRVLTALSPLGPGNDIDVRFADGATIRAKVGHHDRVWDLALLVPQSGKWPEGLTASSRDPVRQDATIRSFSATRGKVAAVPMVLRAHRPLIGGDDRQLDDAIELGSRVTPQDLGAPIVDEEGRVVGILGRGCVPNEGGKPCTPVAFGAPIAAIKGFLRTVPPTAVQPSAWLGIQGVGEPGPVARGVRVTVVHPGSPAHDAQLKGGDRGAGDMILAVDGTPVTSPEELADAIRTHAVGEKVPLTVFGGGKYRQVPVVLRAAPDPRAAPAAAPAHPAELPPADEAPRRRSAAPQK